VNVKVLHAVTSSLSLAFLNGQMRYLRKVGFEPAVVCSPGEQTAVMESVESVPVFTTNMEREISPLRDLLSLVRLFCLVRRLRPAISNVGTPKAGLLVGLAAWLNRVPCRIYTLHGLRLETARGIKRRILTLTERIACACAHRVVCVSPSLQRRAAELRLVSPEKTVVLGSGSCNGVDFSRFAPTPERRAQAAEIRRRLGVEPGTPVLSFAGRFTRDKGVPELMEAFRLVRQRVPKVCLLLIGSYEIGDPVPPETQTAIETDPGVVRIGFTDEIASYYHVMDIFVLPTHREGFPNCVLEAQAAECPVVTTRATGAVDSIEDGVTGFLVPIGDAAATAEAVVRILSDGAMARRMGGCGRERVMRLFRQEFVWKGLADLYRELLRERGLTVPASHSADFAVSVRNS
jgi:glycosyltransferase involved in cell wall biosynthesis